MTECNVNLTKYWDNWCCMTSSSPTTNASDANNCSALTIHVTNDSSASIKLSDGVRSHAFDNCRWRSPTQDEIICHARIYRCHTLK